MGVILFRGKCIEGADSGKWVKGYVSGPCATDTEKGIVSYYFRAVESWGGTKQCMISAETICLCTGKEYMDGETAYEGDIFESQAGGQLMILRFGTYQAYCPVDETYMDSVGFYAECEGYPDMPIGDLKDYALKAGNIFDNTDLVSIQK